MLFESVGIQGSFFFYAYFSLCSSVLLAIGLCTYQDISSWFYVDGISAPHFGVEQQVSELVANLACFLSRRSHMLALSGMEAAEFMKYGIAGPVL